MRRQALGESSDEDGVLRALAKDLAAYTARAVRAPDDALTRLETTKRQ